MEVKDTYGGSTVLTLTSSMGDVYANVRHLSGSSFLSVSGSGNCDTPTSSGSLGVYIGYHNTSGSTLPSNEYLYDIELTDTVSQKRTRLVEGTIQIAKAITTIDPRD